MKINESNVTIMVCDMDKSIQFYQNIGLELKQRWDNYYAMLVAGNMTLGIHPADGKPAVNSGTVSIGFFIDNAKDAKLVLEKNGIEYEYEEDGKSGLYCHFKDPDGTI